LFLNVFAVYHSVVLLYELSTTLFLHLITVKMQRCDLKDWK